jgi:hypothetical protein
MIIVKISSGASINLKGIITKDAEVSWEIFLAKNLRIKTSLHYICR